MLVPLSHFSSTSKGTVTRKGTYVRAVPSRAQGVPSSCRASVCAASPSLPHPSWVTHPSGRCLRSPCWVSDREQMSSLPSWRGLCVYTCTCTHMFRSYPKDLKVTRGRGRGPGDVLWGGFVLTSGLSEARSRAAQPAGGIGGEGVTQAERHHSHSQFKGCGSFLGGVGKSSRPHRMASCSSQPALTYHPLLFSAPSPASSPSPSPSVCLQASVILGSSRPNLGLTLCVPDLYSLLSPPLEYVSSHCPRLVH